MATRKLRTDGASPARGAKPKEARPASVAVLGKRAKAGDHAALDELVARTGSPDQDEVIAATRAIGNARTDEAHRALVQLALESPNRGCHHVAMTQLDLACKKHPSVVELIVAMCEDPRVDELDYPITLLANLAYRDPEELGKDPRVLRSLRRAMGASHVYAQEAAVGTLVKLRDLESLPRMVALLEQEQRGPELFRYVAEAMVALGGGAEELAKLRAARERWTSRESVFDRQLEQLARRVESAAKPRAGRGAGQGSRQR